ncbi:hypothetical protein [Cohnella sp. GCM10012308]|uniref:hypothetical protein n=1 Tax=Cohnella sp. GCM10012308 TaxID=3317329 RepID=UPI0036126EB9
MKQNRFRKWFIGIGCFLVVLLVGAYFGINFAADKVMNSLSDSILENAITSSTPSTDKVKVSTVLPSDTSTINITENNGTDRSESNAPSNFSNPTSNGNSTPNDASGDHSQSYSAEVSVDKAESVKEDITFSEKTKLMTIMLKRLSASDIKTLSDLASGGLSVEKKVEAKKIILEKLSEKEYDELIKIAQKYGMSEGKSYEDSKKEKGMQ